MLKVDDLAILGRLTSHGLRGGSLTKFRLKES